MPRPAVLSRSSRVSPEKKPRFHAELLVGARDLSQRFEKDASKLASNEAQGVRDRGDRDPLRAREIFVARPILVRLEEVVALEDVESRVPPVRGALGAKPLDGD